MTNFCKILLALFLLPGFVLSAFGNSLTNVNLTPAPAGIALITGVPTYPPAVGLLPPATGLKASHPARRTKAGDPDKLNADPIRFSIQCDKRQINLNEEVTLTITAQLLTVSSSQLFFVPGTNDYTLKLILPPGFEQTGGDFTDYVAGTLSAASRPVITYRVRGRFRAVTPGTSFRLLRSHGQANDQSLFAEKSTLVLQSPTPETSVARLRKPAAGPLKSAVSTSAVSTLYVVADNVASGSARSAASDYRGYVDHADCDNVTGWVVDGSNPRQSQEVDIYINGTKVATVLADQTRNDVASATGSRDFNGYGFVWVIPDYYRTNAPLTVSVKPAGVSVDLGSSPRQTSACPGAGTAPSTPAPTPPATPATAGNLAMLPPTYDCATGAIRFNTSGGDGSPIRFRSPGITGWTTNPNQYLDAGARVHDDTPPFTLYAEQSGRAITYSWSRQATCNGTTPPVATTPPAPVAPPATPPTPTSPPVADGACGSGINAIKYDWDGGNNSVSIQINASAGSPQIKLSGPANIDWTNTFRISNSVWYWGNQGMGTGNYTLSVRQPGGAGCSFSFSVPSAGRQLYPADGSNPAPAPSPGCTPPSAPTLSAPGGTQVCNNSTVTLTAAGCSGTVNWSGGQSGSSISVNAAGTYSATCSLNGCTSGASNQLTVTTCAPVSNGRYNRVLYVGNSITLHGGSPFFIVNGQNPKRGMAATSPDKDYVRLMSAKHRELNGGVDNRTLASWNLGGQLDEATGPFWEGNSTKNGVDLGRFDPVTAWKPDLVYIRLGENVADEEITNQSLYQNRLKELIDKLIAQSPGAKVVLSTSVWDRPNYDRAIRAVAAERNYPVADFSDMWPNRFTNGYYAINPSIYGDSGTDNHPDDDGMAHMANKLWDATPK